MTPRKPDPPTTLAAEFACDRRCQVEIDLDDIDGRTTLANLRRMAEQAHDAAHDARPPERFFRVGGHILVRAGQLPCPDGEHFTPRRPVPALRPAHG